MLIQNVNIIDRDRCRCKRWRRGNIGARGRPLPEYKHFVKSDGFPFVVADGDLVLDDLVERVLERRILDGLLIE